MGKNASEGSKRYVVRGRARESVKNKDYRVGEADFDLGEGTDWSMHDLGKGTDWSMHDLGEGMDWSMRDFGEGTDRSMHNLHIV